VKVASTTALAPDGAHAITALIAGAARGSSSGPEGHGALKATMGSLRPERGSTPQSALCAVCGVFWV
jgi:hypothetical protein